MFFKKVQLSKVSFFISLKFNKFHSSKTKSAVSDLALLTLARARLFILEINFFFGLVVEEKHRKLTK